LIVLLLGARYYTVAKLPGVGIIQLLMKEAAVLFYSPYRITGSSMLSQRGRHQLVLATQARSSRFNITIAAALFLSGDEPVKKET
jgi:hypothetical protein